jgi:parallel beta-helix repeat protein
VVVTPVGTPACKNFVTFNTIQSAINASPANTTIDICPGSYAEQLSINKPLTLTGVSNGTADAAVIVAPLMGGLTVNAYDFLYNNFPIEAQIWVSNASPVNINNLVVDGLNNGVTGCSPEVMGILYQNSQGTLNHVTTRNQFIGPEGGALAGCQAGEGIFAETNSGDWTLTVENSSVHDFQKNGITGNGTGQTLIATENYIVGQGATTGAAENGIQIAFGATGTVSGNYVIDDVWAPDVFGDTGDAAAGILLYDTTGTPSVKNNTVGNTQFGIVVDTDTGMTGATSVTGNKVFGTRLYDGIDVCSNGNTVETNTVVNSAESGIHLDATCGSTGNHNTVTGNTLIDACTGVLADTGTSGNTVTPDTFWVAGTTSGSSCASGDGGAIVRLPSGQILGSKHHGGNFRPVR